MKIDKNKITFELDDKEIERFQLALNILNKDGDDVFKELINKISTEALKPSPKPTFLFIDRNNVLAPKLDNSVVRNRIDRWIRNKKGYAYNLLAIFFELYDANEQHIVYRDEMGKLYKERCIDKDHVSDIFIVTFRQMCSDSNRAYGLIFKYNDDHTVSLHPLNKEYILAKKSEIIL